MTGAAGAVATGGPGLTGIGGLFCSATADAAVAGGMGLYAQKGEVQGRGSRGYDDAWDDYGSQPRHSSNRDRVRDAQGHDVQSRGKHRSEQTFVNDVARKWGLDKKERRLLEQEVRKNKPGGEAIPMEEFEAIAEALFGHKKSRTVKQPAELDTPPPTLGETVGMQ
ncbi:MAG: hypothetical protein HQM16_19655 [Deltaproteobacteria bacterium]|nr:hypothetical protein [Deltaproteobacteria bacterium]